MNKIIIERLDTFDIRFPTSLELNGSDANNPAPDYSAGYVILKTNVPGLSGHGLTFTIGDGTDLVVAAINFLSRFVKGKALSTIVSDMPAFHSALARDQQLKWVGPEKGVVHLACAAIVNAVWDLWGKAVNKPVWRLITELSPYDLVRCIDFSYISDALSPRDALDIFQDGCKGKDERIGEILSTGYPAYNTSVGWIGYDDNKIAQLCAIGLRAGWDKFKLKVGLSLEDDIRRCSIVRSVIGDNSLLMLDANQVWNVEEAIDWLHTLKRFNPLWIEEPTSPDDVFGHLAIKQATGIPVATGEQCHNRVMFKQFFRAGAIDYCQVDPCRVGGLTEAISVLLLAHVYDVPVCPHTGGVGLCEISQHLAIVDYIYVSKTNEGRMLEYVDHLHEHFVDPVQIQNGRYQAPTKPGLSQELRTESITGFTYPDGSIWKN